MTEKKFKKKYSQSVKDEMSAAQEKKYEDTDFIIATKKDKVAIIKHYLESEDNAFKYGIKGLAREQFHSEIDSTATSKMSKFTPDEIINTYFHRLRLRHWIKPHKGNFHLYKEALKKLLPYLNDNEDKLEKIDREENDESSCLLNRFEAYLILGVLDNNDADKITELTYDDFIIKRKSVMTCLSVKRHLFMQRRRAKFIPFLSDELLMQRARKAITMSQFYHFKPCFTLDYKRYSHLTHYLFVKRGIGAALMLLLLDKNKESKEILLQLHQQKLPSEFVGILGNFYKRFKDSPENKKLLPDLYNIYPNEWIDEYEERRT